MGYREKLAELARGNESLAGNTEKLVVSGKRMLGVRMADLRKLAKEQVKGLGAEDIRVFMVSIDEGIYDEVMLTGLMIDGAKIADAEKIALMRVYLTKVDSWALIDSVAMGKKKLDRELWWEFIDECLASPEEFSVRYGLVLMISNFLGELSRVLERANRVRHDAYYVKMALAWLYSEVALEDYELAMAEMRDETKDTWVRRKALTKMLESYRIDDEQKASVRKLRDELPKLFALEYSLQRKKQFFRQAV